MTQSHPPPPLPQRETEVGQPLRRLRRGLTVIALLVCALAGVVAAPSGRLAVAPSPATGGLGGAGGGSWTTVASPNPDLNGNYLYSVACPATSFCIAVGEAGLPGSQVSLSEAWNGTNWSAVAVPAFGSASHLTGVSCVSSANCTAVGYATIGGPKVVAISTIWNGTTWQSPTNDDVVIAGSTSSRLDGIACPTAAGCYAVGSYVTSASAGNAIGLVLTLTSGSAAQLATGLGAPSALLGVSCPSPTSCLAVGDSGASALAMLYNGATWGVTPTPLSTGSISNILYSVSCTTASNCVATGSQSSGSNQVLAETWNGVTWSPSPAIDGGGGSLLAGVTCSNTGTPCYSVGALNLGASSQPLVEQDLSDSWAIMSSPAVPAPADLRSVACADPVTCFAVGREHTTVDQTLIERYSAPTIASSVSVSGSPNPASVGTLVTYTATVSPTAAAGTVTWTDNGALMSGCSALLSGTATCTATYGAAATHSIVASYSGDSTYPGSQGSWTENVLATSPPGASLSSSLNPSQFGQSVTLTMTLTPTGPPTISGTVNFFNGGTPIGSAPVTGTGPWTAAISTSGLPTGTDSITADYLGDSNNSPGTASLTQTVTGSVVAAMSPITVTPATPVTGQSITFSASVSGSGTSPTGSVTFTIDGSSSSGPVPLLSGAVTYTLSSGLTAGSHTVSAIYSGDSQYASASSGPRSFTVTAATTATSISSSVNPSYVNHTVTYTINVATVAPGSNAAGTPSGTVTLTDNGVTLCTVAYSGVAPFCNHFYPGSAAGSHTLVATFTSSDGNFLGSDNSGSPLTQSVLQYSTSVTMTVTSGAPTSGQPTTIHIVVTGSPTGGSTPTGTVAIQDNGQFLGNATLGGGAVDYVTSMLQAGTSLPITGTYAGDAAHLPSSVTITPTVAQGTPAVGQVAASPSTSGYGQYVTFSVPVSATGPAVSPTSTVSFFADGSPLGNGTVSGGTASFSTNALVVGAHSITATFNGDSNYVAANGTPLNPFTVTTGGAVPAVGSSSAPSVVGQTVTYTATVNPGGGSAVPTGTVTFRDGGVAIGGCISLVLSGAAQQTCTQTYGAPATHSIDAVYSGDSNYSGPVTSSALTQTVTAAPTQTTLASSANPSVATQPVTFTAGVSVVAPGAGAPTGTVAFAVDGASVGCDSVALSSGTATCALPGWAGTGTYHVTATYSGDSNFASSGAPQVDQLVNPAATTTTVTVPGGTVVTGQSVVATATITGNAPATGNPPSGTVTFSDGVTAVCTATGVTQTGGVTTATCVYTPATAAVHALNVTYNGTSSFAASSGSYDMSVVPASTTTVLGVSPGPTTNYGQTLTVTATVAVAAPGSGAPTGSVTFFDAGTSLGTTPLSSGTATFTTATLLSGSHQLTASYSGDSNYGGSLSGQVAHQVVATTTTALNLAPTSSTIGQSVTFTATVAPGAPNTLVPTGTVTFLDGATTLGTGSLSASGVATLSTSSLAVGAHTITASYPGDAANASSVSGSSVETVSLVATTTTLATSGTPSVATQTVTFTATVSGPGATPTGTVSFNLPAAGTLPGCGAIAVSGGGVATCSDAFAVPGSAHVTAVYSGDASYSGSSSSTVVQTINPASSATALTSAPSSGVVGQPFTLTATVSGIAPATGTPTGTVTFTDGAAAVCSAVAVSAGSGVASCAYTPATAGSRTLTATYSGDTSFATSSGNLGMTISPASTTTTLSVSPSSIAYGQNTTLTATVTANSPGTGIPTGVVTFLDGGSAIGSAPVNGSGVAAFSTIAELAGARSITARYASDGNYASSISTVSPLQVLSAPTDTVLVSSSNPSNAGQSVTFTATVSDIAPNTGTPTGSVRFSDGATTLATVALSSGTAMFSTAVLSVASHPVTASYLGDTYDAVSTSGTVNQVVGLNPTTTTLNSSPNPSVSTQPVVFNASVSASGPPLSGTMDFEVGGVALPGCGAVVLSSGSATCNATFGAPATANVVAVYSGSATDATSSSATLAQVVNKAPTNTNGSVAPSTPVSGQTTTFTATITGTGGATANPTAGTVTFSDGAIVLCAAAAVTSTAGTATATCTVAAGAAGSHTLNLLYNGDTEYAASSGSRSFNVNKSATTTSVSASPSPSTYGSAVTLTATVAAQAPGSGTATGAVTFFDGATSLGTVALNAGDTATLSISTLLSGSHSITANYAGDSSYSGSVSTVATAIVVNAPTTTVLSSAPNPSVVGQSVTLTATVSVNSPNSGVAGGTVQFFDGSTSLGTATLAAGSGSISLTTLTVGTHSLTVMYGGDSLNATSTSAAVTQTVTLIPTTVTLSSSSNPSVSGQPVTYTVTLAPLGTGTMSFTANGSALPGCPTVAISSPTGSCTTVFFLPATELVVAHYSGDATHAASDSNVVTQIINQASTTATLTSAPNPSTVGGSVTYTVSVAVVAPGGGTPGGAVTLTDGGVAIASCSPVALAAGVATCTQTYAAPATHIIQATYAGTSRFAGSSSSPLTQTVNKATPSFSTVSAVPDPSTYGQSVTLTVTMTVPGPAAAAGVTFYLDNSATPLGTVALSGNVATLVLSGSRVPPGSHTFFAGYAGDSNYTLAWSASIADSVSLGAPGLSAPASTLNPSATTQTVTFSVDVSAAGSGAQPTGTVTFSDGSVTLGSGAVGVSGVATFSTSSLAVGSHSITGTYSGDANYSGGTSTTLTQVVTVWAPSVAQPISSLNPSTYGTPLSFSTTVGGPQGAAVDGVVTFLDGTTPLCTAPVSAGAAACSVSATALSGGVHSVSASYGGNAVYGSAQSSALAQTVNAAATATTVASSLAPSTYGQPVTFTITVSSGPGTPTGSVKLKDNGSLLATLTLSGGTTSFTTSALAAGSHPITAFYLGSGNFGASSGGGTQVVGQGATATSTPTASANPVGVTDPVSFTVAVAGASGSPSGTVTFFDGTTPIGSALLSGGVATLATSLATMGNHSITAVYSGDANNSGSASPALLLVVNAGAALISTPTSSLNASLYGQSVTLSTMVSGSVGTPTGSVSFYAGAQLVGTVGIDAAGNAQLTTAGLSIGQHFIGATYGGNPTYEGATSATMTQTVKPDPTTTAAVTINPTASTFGNSVTVSTTVSASIGTPGGTVTFYENGFAVGTATVGSGGGASLQPSAGPAGGNSWTAVYSGDATHSGSTSPAATGTTVGAAPTTTTTGATQAGATTSVTVTVVSNAGTPGGTVTIFDNGNAVGTLPVDAGGGAQWNASTASLPLGTNSFTASYAGSGNYAASASGPSAVVVAPPPTPSPSPSASPIATSPTPSGTGDSGGSLTLSLQNTAALPPGAVSGSLLAQLTNANLRAADIPLVGSSSPTSLPAGLLDTANVPSAQPLGALGALDFGSGLVIWPWLLGITLASCAGLIVARRRWAADEREAEAEDDFFDDTSFQPMPGLA